MAKKISDKERAIQFCLTQPIEVVRELLTTCNVILRTRTPKTEKTQKQERKPRNSGESARTATAGQSSQGE